MRNLHEMIQISGIMALRDLSWHQRNENFWLQLERIPHQNQPENEDIRAV